MAEASVIQSFVARVASADTSRPERHCRLLDDTIYRRVRRALANGVHALDDMVHALRRGRRRILFEAASPMSLAVFRPVLDRLRLDPRLEFWFTTSDRAWHAERIFAAAGVMDRVIASDDARWTKFDAYINTDFWNMTWLPRRTRRIHFFHGVAGKYGLDAPTRIAPVVASFDRLMFANRDRLQKYATAGLVDPNGPEAALIGYPKVDCLVDGSLDADAIRRELGLDATVPTVLYAPTWSPHSSLNTMGLDAISALSRLDVNVIVKLHDRSLDGTARGSGGVDWRRELDRIRNEPRVHVAEDADASRYMCAADALVTDHSSIGFEFMLLDRPVIVVDCPTLIQKANVSREKVALLRSAATVVRSAGETASAVVSSLAEPERHSAARRAIAGDLFYGAGGATARAVQCIYDLLALPAPADQPGRPDAASPDPSAALAASDTRTTLHVR